MVAGFVGTGAQWYLPIGGHDEGVAGGGEGVQVCKEVAVSKGVSRWQCVRRWP